MKRAMEAINKHTFVNAGLVLTCALLLTVGWLSWRNMTFAIQAGHWETHTHYVIEELGELLSSLLDVESGQRGFIITGDQRYLEPYHKALAQLDRHLATLENLTRDNPRQQARLKALEPLVRERLAIIKQSLDLRAAQGFSAAAQVVATGRSQQLMDAIRGHVAEARAEESRLLKERSSAKEAGTRSTILSLVPGGLLSLAVLLLVFTLLKRELAQRLRTERDLREHRDRLHEQVAERKRAEADLQEAFRALESLNSRLQASNGALQDFAVVASHDLQEPLRKIRMISDRLSAKHGAEFSGETLEYLQYLIDATSRMQSLINDLLAFSRVTTRGQAFAPVNLNQVTAEVLSDLSARIEATAARIEVKDLPTLEADPLQMRQLLQNLIANALKFTPAGVAPTVRIYARDRDEQTTQGQDGHKMVQFFIEDHGIGFDEKYLDRIFNVFQRLEGRSAYEGTGMGLAICRKIAERHGGSITARSQPGQGATFIVTLPLSQWKEEFARVA